MIGGFLKDCSGALLEEVPEEAGEGKKSALFFDFATDLSCRGIGGIEGMVDRWIGDWEEVAGDGRGF